MKLLVTVLLPLVLLVLPGCAPDGRQLASSVEPARTADAGYEPAITTPAHPPGTGPLVVVDEAHHNFHTAAGTYAPFATVLERDGYVVERGAIPLVLPALDGPNVVVIADAQPPATTDAPPTFSAAEIESIIAWVAGGGSLFLVTDHMPDPDAIAALAASFGIEVHNGYALRDPAAGGGPLVFGSGDDRLIPHQLVRGPTPANAVSSVATFAGSAFRADPPFEPLLVFGPGVRSWVPREYGQIGSTTPSVDVAGWYQGGVREFGKGRLAMFSEAAMFTAQLFDEGRSPVGLNHELAAGNLQLLRNVMGWLTSREDRP